MDKKTFLLIWKTSDNKFQIVKGDDIADACNNAGIGHGALPALDVHVDVTEIFKKKMLFKCLLAVLEWHKKGAFWWKHETCAKLERILLLDVVYDEKDIKKANKGWRINDAGRFILSKVEERCSKP